MDTWIIYVVNQYGSPKIRQIEVQAYDVGSAINSGVASVSEIIAVKLKITTETTVGL